MEGFLTKRGHVRKSWKLRYFNAKDGRLLYASSKGAKPKGQLFLRGGTVAVVDEAKHKKPWCFEVRSGGSALIAQATNEEERDAWVAALQAEANRAPVCEGIITIHFKGHKSRPRYCAVFGSTLYCFVAKGKDLLGQWDLSDGSVSVPNDGLLVTVTCGDDCVHLEPCSESEQRQWLTALNDALTVCSTGPVATGNNAAAAPDGSMPRSDTLDSDESGFDSDRRTASVFEGQSGDTPGALVLSATPTPAVTNAPPELIYLPEQSRADAGGDVGSDASGHEVTVHQPPTHAEEIRTPTPQAVVVPAAINVRVPPPASVKTTSPSEPQVVGTVASTTVQEWVGDDSDNDDGLDGVEDSDSDPDVAESQRQLAAAKARARLADEKLRALRDGAAKVPPIDTQATVGVESTQFAAVIDAAPSDHHRAPLVFAPVPKHSPPPPPVQTSVATPLKGDHDPRVSDILSPAQIFARSLQQSKEVPAVAVSGQDDSLATPVDDTDAASVSDRRSSRWLASSDSSVRANMRRKIQEYLITHASSRPEHIATLRSKLPELVPRLEAILYESSSTEEEFNNASTFRRRLRRLLKSSAYSNSYAFSVTGGDNESVAGSVISTNSFKYDGGSFAESLVLGRSFQEDSVPQPDKLHPSNVGRRVGGASVDTPRLAAFTPSMQTVQEDALSPRSEASPRLTPVTAMKPPPPEPSPSSNSIVRATHARKSRGVSFESNNDSVTSLPAPPPPPYTRYGLVAHPGSLTIRHFPSRDDGGLHLLLVLEHRYDSPPHLPTLNKWQMRQCAKCSATQTTGMFGLKANYCNYTELLFCSNCFGSQQRAIPWRVVHNLDVKQYPVSRVAAEFLDNVYALPVVNLRSVSTRLYASSKPLQHQRTLRMRLCRLKDSLEAFPEINSLLRRDLGSSCVYMAESADMYSLDDVARAADGDFVRPLEAAIASLKSFAELRSVSIALDPVVTRGPTG